MTRRSPRPSTEIRELVLQAATTLFAERGYARVATRDIARSADVTPSQLFAHFGTKARLFASAVVEPYVALVAGIAERWQDAHVAPEDTESLAAFNRVVLEELFDVTDREPGLMTALIIAEAHEESLVDEIAPSLQPVDDALRPVEQLVRVPDSADPDAPVLVVRLTHGTVTAAIQFRPWLASHIPDRESAITAMADLLTHGLGVPDGAAATPVTTGRMRAPRARAKTDPDAAAPSGMRLRLLDAAAELFTRRGYPGASTRSIALAAGTSETILFRHFPTKSALFEQAVSCPWSAAVEDFLARTSELELIPLIVELYHLFHRHRPTLIALLEFERQETEPTGTAATVAALLDRLQNRLPDGLADPAATAGVIGAAILGGAVLDVWLFTGHTPKTDLVIAALIDLVCSGVPVR